MTNAPYKAYRASAIHLFYKEKTAPEGREKILGLFRGFGGPPVWRGEGGSHRGSADTLFEKVHICGHESPEADRVCRRLNLLPEVLPEA